MILIADILKTVRQIINEATTDTDDFSKETDDALKEFIRLALGMLMKEDDVLGDETTDEADGNVTWKSRPDGNKYAVIKLPSDFFRFISVNLSGWARPVTDLQTTDGPLFKAQYSSCKGIGNGPNMPVAFLGPGSIVAHSVTQEGTHQLSYVKVPEFEADGLNISIPQRYSDSLSYYAAALYHQSINDTTDSQSEFAIGKNLIKKIKSYE